MKIPANAKVYSMLTSLIWIEEDDIVYSLPREDAPTRSSDEEMLEDFRNLKEIIGNKKIFLILEINPKRESPSKARRDLVADQLKDITKGIAIITRSPVSKMIANLFFGLKTPAYPTRMFTDVEEAKTWIKSLNV